VSNSVNILGSGPGNLAVNGNAASRVFYISNGVSVALSGLTITNGFVNSDSSPATSGGGIYNDHSTLTVSNCTVSGNSANEGGGIYNYGFNVGGATLRVSGSTLSGNSAALFGGGIENNGGAGNATATV